jgi:hypothetical protein
MSLDADLLSLSFYNVRDSNTTTRKKSAPLSLLSLLCNLKRPVGPLQCGSSHEPVNGKSCTVMDARLGMATGCRNEMFLLIR